MDALMQDIRFAIRTLTKAPLFTALCVLCLAVGIGLNANIYSAVYAVFQRPFPYADPDQLVSFEQRHLKRGFENQTVSYETFKDIQKQATYFDQSAGMSFRSITITDTDEPILLQGELVSWNLFPMLGVQPHIGRFFRPDEDVAGAPAAIMLGYGIWEKRYAADSSIIGRSLPVNGLPHTVVGVMPRGFMFPDRDEAWIPMAPLLERRTRDAWDIQMLARLKPGAQLDVVNAQLSSISTRIAQLRPKESADWEIYAAPLRETFIDGVVSATASNQIPLSGGGSGGRAEIEGKPVTNLGDAPNVGWTGVTTNWLATLGVPLLTGRSFSSDEARERSPVAIINESMARQFWPNGDPLGRRFRLAGDTSNQWLTVIGVHRDYTTNNLDDPGPIGPNYITSYRHLPTRNTGIIVRTAGDPAQITASVRKAIRESDAALPVFEVHTMEELRRLGFWSQRRFGWMFSMFGIVALVLASVGVYGVIAYSVSQRTQEIGVRVALGAQPGDVVRLLVRNGAMLALAGIAIGLVGALGVTRVIQSLLIGVSPTDTLSFVGVTVFLAAVALVASYVPARRATRVDPLTALRSE